MPDPSPPPPLPESVLLIGAGRLGMHLCVALLAAGIPRVTLWNRRPLPAERETLLDTGLSALPPEQRVRLERLDGASLDTFLEKFLVPQAPDDASPPLLIFLTVTDDALTPTAQWLMEKLKHLGTAPDSCSPLISINSRISAVLHCSGALSLAALEPLRQGGIAVGTLHPLQSFAGVPRAQTMVGTYCALEGSESIETIARALVERVGGHTIRLREGGKLLYHASAVIASNLMVALTSLAVKVLGNATEGETSETERLAMLLPLIEGSVHNLKTQGLSTGIAAALTGPVSRGDAGIVGRQWQALQPNTLESGSASPEGVAEIYRLLSLEAIALTKARGMSPERISALLHALNSTNFF